MGKRYRVIRATTNPIPGLALDKNHGVKFKSNGSDVIVDAGVAREIESAFGPKGNEHPGQVVVVPMDFPGQYTGKLFSVPELPWKRQEGTE